MLRTRPDPRWQAILPVLITACTLDLSAQATPDAPLERQWAPGEVSVTGARAMLTPEERDVVVHMTLARTNPAAYATHFLLPHRVLFQGQVDVDPLDAGGHGLRTHEGAAAVEAAAAELRETASMGTLSVSATLPRAAHEPAAADPPP